MNKNVLIVLGGGFVIAILVALIVQSGLKGSKKKEPAGDVTKVEILVASRDISIGTVLSSSNMTWREWPEGLVSASALTREDGIDVEDAMQGRVKRDIYKDEPITEDALVDEDELNFLAASLEHGMRAVAIDVKAATMVGGFINPGDYVDVLLTYQVKIKGLDREEMQATINKYATETIIKNVKILAIDQTSDKKDDKVKVGRTVTLAVKTEEAEVLALASKMGDLSLSLRPIGEEVSDVVRKVTTDVSVSRVMQELLNDSESTAEDEPKKAAKGRADIVRVYSGGTVENIPVRSLYEPSAQK